MAMSFLQKNSDRNLTLKPNTMKTKIKELHNAWCADVKNRIENKILTITFPEWLDSLPPSSMEESKSAEDVRVNLLAMDSAYPLHDSLRLLIKAANKLLIDKGYDGHDYEEMEQAVRAGEKSISDIKKYLASQFKSPASTILGGYETPMQKVARESEQPSVVDENNFVSIAEDFLNDKSPAVSESTILKNIIETITQETSKSIDKEELLLLLKLNLKQPHPAIEDEGKMCKCAASEMHNINGKFICATCNKPQF